MPLLMPAPSAVQASTRPPPAVARQTPCALAALRIATTASLRLQNALRLQIQPAQAVQHTAKCAAQAAHAWNVMLVMGWLMTTLAGRCLLQVLPRKTVQIDFLRQRMDIATIATTLERHAPALR